MTIRELDIPGLNADDDVERQVNVVLRSGDDVFVRLPVFSYVYSDTPMDLGAQTERLREDLASVRAFFIENSLGRFHVDCMIRSARLDNPRDWTGNLTGVKPRYHPETHVLINPGDFVAVNEYTGYEPIRIYRRNPDVVTAVIDNKDYFRTYESQTRRNIMRDVIAAARLQVHDGDDPFTVDAMMARALVPGQRGHAVLASSAVGAAVVRGDFAPLPVGHGRHIHRLALNGIGSMSVHAHELGHLLLGLGDHYWHRQADGRLLEVSRNGFLGMSSLMGLGHGGTLDIHLHAVAKCQLGWLDPVLVEPTFVSRDIILNPVYSASGNAVLIRPDRHRKPGEFFLLEYRSREATGRDGNAIRFDQRLGDELEDGVVVYHVNTTGAGGGVVGSAEPFIDVEGEVAGSARVVAMHGGEQLDEEDTAFYGGHANGLRLDFRGKNADGAQVITVSWTREPKLDGIATFPDDTLHLVGRDAGGSPVYRQVGATGNVDAWTSLSGACLGRPRVSRAGSALHIQIRGVSGRPFTKVLDESSVHTIDGPWQRLDGRITHEPTAVKHGASVYLAVRGVSGRAFYQRYDNTDHTGGSAPWIKVDDTRIAGRPTLVASMDGGLHLFARGEDDRPLHCRPLDDAGDARRRWTDLGGRISADMAGVHDLETGAVHIVVRGVSGRVFHKRLDGETWSPGAERWDDLGGQVLGPVSVVRARDGILHLLATGVSGSAFHNRFDGSHWSGWDNLGGQLIDTPVAVARVVDSQRVDVFATGISGSAFHKWWDGDQWQPGQRDWSAIGGEFI